MIGAGLNGKGLLRNQFAADLSLRSPGLAGGWDVGRLRSNLTESCCSNGAAPSDRPADRILVQLQRCRDWPSAAPKLTPMSSCPSASTNGWAMSALLPRRSAIPAFRPAGGQYVSVDGGISRTNFTFALDRAGLRSAPLTVQAVALEAKGYAGLERRQASRLRRAAISILRAARSIAARWAAFKVLRRKQRDTPSRPVARAHCTGA